MRETAVVSKAAGWLQMSDVALLKKLRQSERWLQTLCLKLLEESEIAWPADKGIRMRLVDGTHVKEPGQTGSQWRAHYSLSVPEWTCDFFGLTSCKGAGTGESLCQYPVRPGDCLVGDRGYAQAAGIAHVHRRHGFVLVRHNAQTLPLAGQNGSPLDVLAWLRNLKQAGQLDSQAVWVPVADGPNVPARLCAVRKSEEAIIASRRKICRRAQRKSQELRPETLEYAQWVMALTTVPAGRMDARTVLEWYRIRWQVELAFRRFEVACRLRSPPQTRSGLVPRLALRKAPRRAPDRTHATVRRSNFPPGAGTGADRNRHRSQWRETDVLLRLVASSIWPPLSINDCLENWKTIQSDLSERPRNRVPQTQRLPNLSC